jgi:hypothetical protein
MKLRIFAIASAALFVAACGSSKKSSPPAGTGPNITYSGPVTPASFNGTTDKAAVASSAVTIAQSLGGFSEMATMFAAGTSQGGPTVYNALLAAADVYNRPDAATASGVVQSQPQPCPGGGTGTFTVNRTSQTSTTSGDYVEMAFAACKNQNGDVANGSFRLTFTSTVADDFVMLASSITTDRSFAMTISFNEFSTVFSQGGWSGIDGDITLAFSAVVSTGTLTFSISGSQFTEAAGSGQITEALQLRPLNGQSTYSDTATQVYSGMGTPGATALYSTWALNARLCTTAMGGLNGCANIATNPAFRINESYTYPASGTLKVSDDAGDYVQVTAVSQSTGACTLSWSIDGSTGSQATTWDSL